MFFQVEIFTSLVNKHNIETSKMTVLSQYKAQCNAVKERLEETGFSDFTVSTVVASQGQ